MLFLASNDSPDVFFGIPLTQRIETDKPLLIFPFDRSIFAPLDFIAHFFQLTQKGIKVSGRIFQDSVNIVANLVSVGGALLIDRSLSPLGIGHLFNDGQPMFQTDQVAQSLNDQSGIIEVLELVDTVQRGGIEDYVVVYMGTVGMSCNDKRMFSLGKALCQFIPNLICFLRSNLSRLE